MKTGNRIKPEGDSGKKNNSAVPNPNPNPNREIVQNPNKRIKETERGRGEGSGLPRRRARHHAGKRKGRPGVNCSPEQATEAPRPGRSTAARSPAGERARRRGGRRRRRGSLLALAVEAPRSVTAAAGLSGEKRAVRRRERESEGRMALGFKGAAAVAVLILRCARTAVGWRGTAEMEWAKSWPRRARGTLPAQAQVVAWVRPVRVKRSGPSCFGCWIGPKWPNKIVQSQF